MKVFILIILVGLVVAVGFQVFTLRSERMKLQANLRSITESFDKLRVENEDLRADMEYFSKPENLEKELRARFHYKKPGEEMLIIVP